MQFCSIFSGARENHAISNHHNTRHTRRCHCWVHKGAFPGPARRANTSNRNTHRFRRWDHNPAFPKSPRHPTRRSLGKRPAQEYNRRKKKQREHLPWYRARNYKGNLTEIEKRQLDSFRMQEKHPAGDYDSLPEEVQRYISSLEIEVYDNKQQTLALSTLFVSGVGGYFLIRYMLGYDEGSSSVTCGAFRC
jgi:hypothetical protein